MGLITSCVYNLKSLAVTTLRENVFNIHVYLCLHLPLKHSHVLGFATTKRFKPFEARQQTGGGSKNSSDTSDVQIPGPDMESFFHGNAGIENVI